MDKKVQMTVAVLAVIVIVAAAFFVVIGNNGDDTPKEAVSSECRLWVVGNANMDDSIDQKDIDYVQSVIDGKNKAPILNLGTNSLSENVNMADVDRDGDVDEDDIAALKKLIKKDVSVIHYVDVDGVCNSVHYPIKSVVALYYNSIQQLYLLDKQDLVVACDSGTSKGRPYSPELDSKAVLTERFDPSAETIMNFNPDVILTGSRAWYCVQLENDLPSNRTNMDVLRIPSWEDGNMAAGVVTLGFLLDAEDKAKKYTDFIDPILKEISDKTSTLSEDDKKTVLVVKGRENAKYEANGVGSGRYETSVLAGIVNYADMLNPGKDQDYPKFTDEWLMQQSKLDYIIYTGSDKLVDPDYNKNWTAQQSKAYQTLTNAYGTEIHTISDMCMLGPFYIIGVIYIADWCYPDLLDMDADALFQEFIDTFYPQWNFDVSEYNKNGGGVAV